MQKAPNKPISQEYKFTLKSMLKFEIISFLGRAFLSHLPSRTPAFHKLNAKGEKNYLNLGCGAQFKQTMGGGV
ncbi:hypothetical protein OQH61_00715 [Helicobacter sp. MIT 21-1697]|uniref:hypothetical protein n=1 Tax=Helicobacter sp. MIT 21-1697 TaxID=2993733 RepID=UPI00224B1289|nr:hypothetical protein [Helicobacter sp. MIT 21-1697]MCX2716263.1 hypothetical protein [Helicobacter sp. MIT 21-1697]